MEMARSAELAARASGMAKSIAIRIVPWVSFWLKLYIVVLRMSKPGRLHGFPLSGFRGAHDGFDDGHILDGIFERHGRRSAFLDGSRKQIALDGVLVAWRELFNGDAGALDIATIV